MMSEFIRICVFNNVPSKDDAQAEELFGFNPFSYHTAFALASLSGLPMCEYRWVLA
jgi:hypothetical protein